MPTDTLIPNAIVLTNWVTQTNAVSAWNDPLLWFTGGGIIVSSILIYRQVAIMKEQAKISTRQMEIDKLKTFQENLERRFPIEDRKILLRLEVQKTLFINSMRNVMCGNTDSLADIDSIAYNIYEVTGCLEEVRNHILIDSPVREFIDNFIADIEPFLNFISTNQYKHYHTYWDPEPMEDFKLAFLYFMQSFQDIYYWLYSIDNFYLKKQILRQLKEAISLLRKSEESFTIQTNEYRKNGNKHPTNEYRKNGNKHPIQKSMDLHEDGEF